MRAGEGVIRAGYPSTNFEIQKYHQNKPKFTDVFSRNNLPKIKDGAHVINLDGYRSIGIHRISLYMNSDNVTYFDSFGVGYIPKEIKKFISSKNIKTNINKIQANDSIMCTYFCISFFVIILKDKSFLDYTNLLFPDEHEKYNKIILKYFQ